MECAVGNCSHFYLVRIFLGYLNHWILQPNKVVHFSHLPSMCKIQDFLVFNISPEDFAEDTTSTIQTSYLTLSTLRLRPYVVGKVSSGKSLGSARRKDRFCVLDFSLVKLLILF